MLSRRSECVSDESGDIWVIVYAGEKAIADFIFSRYQDPKAHPYLCQRIEDEQAQEDQRFDLLAERRASA